MHQFHPSILRKYDIRGVVGDTLTTDDVYAAGQCFGDLACESGVSTVAVCRDGRLSSPEFEESLVAGITSTGINVVKVGMGPTPLLYYAVKGSDDIGGGVMITGSHNDQTYNGLKMMLEARPIWGADIKDFQRRIGTVSVKDSGHVSERDVSKDYLQRILQDLALDPSLKVVWDCGNGAAGELMQELVKSLPGEHTLLYADVDGTFPNHHPDPTVEKNMGDLKKAVADKGADIGIGFDGDGDRIGVISKSGQMIFGDQQMILYGRDVLKNHPGATILVDVKTSKLVLDDLRTHGGDPRLCATGHSSIKAMMKETGALLAGELSGHIFFADKYYGYDDALYAALRLLNIISEGKDIDALLADMPKSFKTPEMGIPCADERKFDVMARIQERVKSMDCGTVIDMDGVRVETESGWWLLRASNTESMLVARAEADSEENLEVFLEELQFFLRKEGLEIPGQ